MTAISRMLAASDLSPRAQLALARAALLAREHASALSLIHVVEPVHPVPVDAIAWPPEVLPADLEAQAMSDARQELNKQLVSLGSPGAEIEIRRGTPFLEIILAARQGHADLTVLGAHGRRYLHDLLLGTTAERVVRKGQQLTLVVKNPAREAYRRILVPTDFSETSVRALQTGSRVAPAARITLLHVYDLSFELRAAEIGAERLRALQEQYEPGIRAKLKELVAQAGLDPGAVDLDVRYGYPGQVIPLACREQRADLVAIGTRGLTDMRYVLLGSVAEHVLREVPADVLVVPPPTHVFELP